MSGPDIICIVTIGTFIALPFAALLLSAYGTSNRRDENGNEILGPGPRCDVCGRYLSEHGMWECETYC